MKYKNDVSYFRVSNLFMIELDENNVIIGTDRKAQILKQILLLSLYLIFTIVLVNFSGGFIKDLIAVDVGLSTKEIIITYISVMNYITLSFVLIAVAYTVTFNYARHGKFGFMSYKDLEKIGLISVLFFFVLSIYPFLPVASKILILGLLLSKDIIGTLKNIITMATFLKTGKRENKRYYGELLYSPKDVHRPMDTIIKLGTTNNKKGYLLNVNRDVTQNTTTMNIAIRSRIGTYSIIKYHNFEILNDKGEKVATLDNYPTKCQNKMRK